MKIKIPHWAIKAALSIADLESFGDTSKPDMRMYEYSWAISILTRQTTGRLLDIGCTASLNMIPATMCELGWSVYGLDIRDFAFTHNNFHFVKDMSELYDIKFDAITAISSLEHFGISGRYGIQKSNLSVAKDTADIAKEMLNRHGIFLVTVPFTFDNAKITNNMMIYDKKSLQELMKPLETILTMKETTAMMCGIKR